MSRPCGGAGGGEMKCQCGHNPEDHHRLPGHPDGAEECWGSDECECGQYRAGRYTDMSLGPEYER